MNIDAAVPPKRSGLAILWDTIIAPNAAFESIRLKPRWVVALIACLVVGTIGIALEVPAITHVGVTVFPKMVATNPSLAGMSPEKQAAMLETIKRTYQLTPIFTPFVMAFALAMSALVMFVAARVGRSMITYGLAFSLACNIGFIYYGLFNLLVGVMVTLRGAETYMQTTDVFGALPSLAWAAPGAAPKLLAFLTMVNIFTIWSFVLTALGLRKAAGLGTVASYVVATIFFLTVTLTQVAGAQ